jgi:hypothetical protein
VLELRPFDNVNSAALAVVASDAIAIAFAVILDVLEFILLVKLLFI